MERDDAQERHLYLTDYRSLVVADLTEVAFDEPGGGEPTCPAPRRGGGVPASYAAQGFRCDA